MPMEPESGILPPPNPSQLSWVNLSRNLILAYQSFGVVYGDLSTSPLYVYRSIFTGKLQNNQNEEAIFGAFLLIFWTLTLIPLLKYVFFLLSVDDNSEGGTFALYSLLCRHEKFSLLPNLQAADEELSAYKFGPSRQAPSSLPLKRFLKKHRRSCTALLIVVLLGACMVIGDGVITPAISVLSSMSGLQVTEHKLTDGAEAMFADLGHFTALSIRAWGVACTICVLLTFSHLSFVHFIILVSLQSGEFNASGFPWEEGNG